MTADYQARDDTVRNEFREILASPSAVGDDRVADPWARSGELPSEYVKMGNNSEWETSDLGGIW